MLEDCSYFKYDEEATKCTVTRGELDPNWQCSDFPEATAVAVKGTVSCDILGEYLANSRAAK